MKRIIMSILLITMFLPITVIAKDINDFKHKWTEKFDNPIKYFIADNDSVIIATGNNIHRINVSNSKTKTITIEETVIDLIYIDDYLFVSAISGEYENYRLHIYKLDKKLNILKKSSLFTGIKSVSGTFYIYNNELYLEEYNSGYLIKKDTTIVPQLLNSDGSYWSHSYDNFVLYNKNGELVKTLKDIGTDIIKYNENYIVIRKTSGEYNKESEYKISLYDENLSIVKKTVNITLRSANCYFILDKNGDIYLENYYYENSNYYYQYYKLNKDLELAETEKPARWQNERNDNNTRAFADNNAKNYDKQELSDQESEAIYQKLREYHQLEELKENNDGDFLTIRELYKDDNNNYIANYAVHLLPPKVNEKNPCIFYISYINEKKEILFTKELFRTTNVALVGANLVHNVPYVITNKVDEYVIAVYMDEENTYYLNVYNETGDLLKKETLLKTASLELIWTVKKTTNGLLIVIDRENPVTGLSNNESIINPSYLSKNTISKPMFLENKQDGTYVIYYSFPYYITTKTDGNGKIKVVEKADSGEEIQYEVIPNEGYKVKEVKVTDEDGNEIIFKDSKFTMPSADVVIEASFLQEKVASEKEEETEEKNPETTDVFMLMIAILIISLESFVVLSIKLKNTN